MLFNVFHSHMLALISCLFAIEEQHESPHRRGDICLGGLSPAYYWYWASTWTARYWTHAKRWIEWKITLGTRTLSCEYGVLALVRRLNLRGPFHQVTDSTHIIITLRVAFF